MDHSDLSDDDGILFLHNHSNDLNRIVTDRRDQWYSPSDLDSIEVYKVEVLTGVGKAIREYIHLIRMITTGIRSVQVVASVVRLSLQLREPSRDVVLASATLKGEKPLPEVELSPSDEAAIEIIMIRAAVQKKFNEGKISLADYDGLLRELTGEGSPEIEISRELMADITSKVGITTKYDEGIKNPATKPCDDGLVSQVVIFLDLPEISLLNYLAFYCLYLVRACVKKPESVAKALSEKFDISASSVLNVPDMKAVTFTPEQVKMIGASLGTQSPYLKTILVPILKVRDQLTTPTIWQVTQTSCMLHLRGNGLPLIEYFVRVLQTLECNDVAKALKKVLSSHTAKSVNRIANFLRRYSTDTVGISYCRLLLPGKMEFMSFKENDFFLYVCMYVIEPDENAEDSIWDVVKPPLNENMRQDAKNLAKQWSADLRSEITVISGGMDVTGDSAKAAYSHTTELAKRMQTEREHMEFQRNIQEELYKALKEKKIQQSEKILSAIHRADPDDHVLIARLTNALQDLIGSSSFTQPVAPTSEPDFVTNARAQYTKAHTNWTKATKEYNRAKEEYIRKEEELPSSTDGNYSAKLEEVKILKGRMMIAKSRAMNAKTEAEQKSELLMLTHRTMTSVEKEKVRAEGTLETKIHSLEMEKEMIKEKNRIADSLRNSLRRSGSFEIPGSDVDDEEIPGLGDERKESGDDSADFEI